MWRRSGGICLPRVFCTGWSILSSGTTRPGQLSAVPAAHNNAHHTSYSANNFSCLTLINETGVLQDKYVVTMPLAHDKNYTPLIGATQ